MASPLCQRRFILRHGKLTRAMSGVASLK
jgi:hypothetical protein